MLATIAPRQYRNEYQHLCEDHDHYNTIIIRQDEVSALKCVDEAKALNENIDRWQGNSVEICDIGGVSVRLTVNNNLHIKLPGLGRRWVYDYSLGPKSLLLRATDGSPVYFDRHFPMVFQTQELVDKLARILAKQRAIIEAEIEDDLCNPPADLIEDDSIEETPSTLDLLR